MPKRRKSNPIDDYIEWTEHRYDPGYYLGGNIPPYLRARDDRRDPSGKKLPPRPRRLGLVLLVSGTAALFIALASLATASTGVAWLDRLDVVLELAVAVLFVGAAWRILRG